jgi:hypothetical protein
VFPIYLVMRTSLEQKTVLVQSYSVSNFKTKLSKT